MDEQLPPVEVLTDSANTPEQVSALVSKEFTNVLSSSDTPL